MEKVGKKLRAVRKNKKITLSELSKLTGLSVSFISQVERNVSSITITSLKKIADELGISMHEIFEIDQEDEFIRNKENQVTWHMGNDVISHTRVSGKFESRKLEGLIYKIEPHSSDTEVFSHSGEELHYILNGTASVTIEDDVYKVQKGETIHFPSTLPHMIMNASDEVLEVLCVLTPIIF